MAAQKTKEGKVRYFLLVLEDWLVDWEGQVAWDHSAIRSLLG